jgi:hypothetical protein
MSMAETDRDRRRPVAAVLAETIPQARHYRNVTTYRRQKTRMVRDRDVDGPQAARLVAALLDRDRRGAAGSVVPVNRAAGGFLCSVAALNKVRTGVAQRADLLELGLGGSDRLPGHPQ